MIVFPVRLKRPSASFIWDANDCPVCEVYGDQADALLLVSALNERWARNLRVPYPEFCRDPKKCAGRSRCPLDKCCAD